MKNKLTFGEKLELFDYENFKKKVLKNIPKYDKNNLVGIIKKARDGGNEEVRLGPMKFYLADRYILESLSAYHEDMELGAGFWESFIFLTKEAHEVFLKDKERHFIECFSVFVKMGIV